ncbi:GNAT family N-acetyltransferase [Embleya sp. NPDC020630]|uniref:GNAT family N-acetyltransferase n=1 Tax=Embleya sp. NPDC020630 TaxID=3363979 RepID=UPI00379D7228
MTAPTIRAARADDYDAIAAVVDDWWGRPMTPALPRLFLDHFHTTSLVAEDVDGLGGFLIGLLSPSRVDEAYVHFVAVRPDLRRSGLAAELYERFFALARAAGRLRVRAITGPGNTGSVRFHTTMGFTVHGPVADLDGPGRDRMRFERSLDVGPGA